MKRRYSHERHELASAALDGIRTYLKSIRGCAMLGVETSAIAIDGGVEVNAVIDGRNVEFLLTVKVPTKKGA